MKRFLAFVQRWYSVWQRRRYALAYGFFWFPCPICKEYFGGHEAVSDPVLKETKDRGWLICRKPSCAVEAVRRNHENGL